MTTEVDREAIDVKPRAAASSPHSRIPGTGES